MFSNWIWTVCTLAIWLAAFTQAQSVSPEQCSSLASVAASQNPQQRSSQSAACSSQVGYMNPPPSTVTQTTSVHTTLTKVFSTTITTTAAITIISTTTTVTTVLYHDQPPVPPLPRDPLEVRQVIGPPPKSYLSSLCSCLGVTGPQTPIITSQFTSTVTDFQGTSLVVTKTVGGTVTTVVTTTSTYTSTPVRFSTTLPPPRV